MDRISRTSFTYRPELPQPKARRQYPVGTISLKQGEKLGFYAGTCGKYASGIFVNEAQQEVGYSDLLPRNQSLELIFVYPEFRHRGYSAAILQASLLGLQQRSFSDQAVSSAKGYVRHPFMGRTLLRHGFNLGRSVDILTGQQDPRLEIVLSPLPDVDGKVPIFVRDLKWVDIFRKFCENPNNPDWAPFKVVDEPLEGDQLTLFTSYYFNRPADLHRQISLSGSSFAFYL